MRIITGLFVILAGVLLGLYVGFYLLFIGGIVQIVEALQTDPASASGLAWGIARVIVAGGVGWGIAVVSFAAGIALIESHPYAKGRPKDRQTAKQVEQNWKRTVGR